MSWARVRRGLGSGPWHRRSRSVTACGGTANILTRIFRGEWPTPTFWSFRGHGRGDVRARGARSHGGGASRHHDRAPRRGAGGQRAGSTGLEVPLRDVAALAQALERSVATRLAADDGRGRPQRVAEAVHRKRDAERTPAVRADPRRPERSSPRPRAALCTPEPCVSGRAPASEILLYLSISTT